MLAVGQLTACARVAGSGPQGSPAALEGGHPNYIPSPARQRRCHMKTIARLAAAWIGVTALGASAAWAAPDKKPDVSENDKLQFTQKEVQALMQELQERMFHLAELTKQAEPDNSTRLLLALRKA